MLLPHLASVSSLIPAGSLGNYWTVGGQMVGTSGVRFRSNNQGCVKALKAGRSRKLSRMLHISDHVPVPVLVISSCTSSQNLHDIMDEQSIHNFTDRSAPIENARPHINLTYLGESFRFWGASAIVIHDPCVISPGPCRLSHFKRDTACAILEQAAGAISCVFGR
ncbi:hypothetical protein F4604DRAFT_727127 [Suillus subluteus]|nr:hypothetical protein F4604DRAFT_727127 [Suillus subluteus]